MLVGVALGVAAWLVAAPWLQPLRVDQPTHDFGRVTAGQRPEHVFTVRNVGRSPRRLTGSYTDCGCVAAKLSDMLVRPGGAVRYSVRFDPEGYRGEVRKHVRLDHDGLGGPLRMSLRADVDSVLWCEPAVADFGLVEAGKTSSAMVRIRNPHHHRIESVRWDSTAPGRISAQINRPDGADGDLTIELVAERLMLGPLAESGELDAGLPGLPPLKLSLQGRCHSPYPISDEALIFGFVQRNETAVRTVRIDGLLPEQVAGIHTSLPDEVIALSVASSPAGTILTAGLTAQKLAAGPFSGEVVLRLADDRVGELRLAVLGSVVPDR